MNTLTKEEQRRKEKDALNDYMLGYPKGQIQKDRGVTRYELENIVERQTEELYYYKVPVVAGMFWSTKLMARLLLSEFMDFTSRDAMRYERAQERLEELLIKVPIKEVLNERERIGCNEALREQDVRFWEAIHRREGRTRGHICANA